MKFSLTHDPKYNQGSSSHLVKGQFQKLSANTTHQGEGHTAFVYNQEEEIDGHFYLSLQHQTESQAGLETGRMSKPVKLKENEE